MLGSRLIRIAAALFVGVAVINMLWPQATGHVSKFAVINAPIVTVRAPMDGVVVDGTPGFAMPVRRDDVVMSLHGSYESRADITRAEAEVAGRARQFEGLLREEAHLAEILETLKVRARREQDSEVAYLTHRIDEIEAVRRMHAVDWDRASSELDRLKQLAAKGNIPAAQVDAARFAAEVAEAQMTVDDATIASLEVEMAAIEDGLPSPAGTGRRDFGHDRIDDMAILLQDIRTRRLTAEGQLAGARANVAALSSEFDGMRRFAPTASTASTASTDGIIWTASRRKGAAVTAGADLFQVLDCDRRFLEVVFDERAFESLAPGTEATVRLRGSDRGFRAVVSSRHASGGGSAVAAIDEAVAGRAVKDGVTVFLRLDPADVSDPEVAAAFCDVGRTAEVQIKDPRIDDFLAPVVSALQRVRGAFDPAVASLDLPRP